MKVSQRTLSYLKVTINFGLFYDFFNYFEFVGYCDGNFARDANDRKSNIGLVIFFYGRLCYLMVF